MRYTNKVGVSELGETACLQWQEDEDKFFSEVDHEPPEAPADPIADLSDEEKRTLVAVVASCLSTRQRQVLILHHGVILPRMTHKLIASKLGLTEAEVDEIFYTARMQIENLIKNLSDLLEDHSTPALKVLHLWTAN